MAEKKTAGPSTLEGEHCWCRYHSKSMEYLAKKVGLGNWVGVVGDPRRQKPDGAGRTGR